MALPCTDSQHRPPIVIRFLRRRQIEAIIQTVRTHPGGAMQRQWPVPAIARATPALT